MRRSLALAALVLSATIACGNDGGDESGEAQARVAKIAVIAPLDDGLVQFGRGIRNSVELAVREANDRQALPEGWRLEVLALNDSSDPAVGKQAAEEAAADPAVFGVVGTYNSGVAAEVVPVLDAAGIVMVSPGNTDPTLTLGPDPDNPVRPHTNYFRMVAADNVQAPFLAGYAYGDAGARRVSVVSETKPVSKGLADDFSAAFTASGGQVVSTRVVPDETTDYAEVVKEIAPLRPDLLFYGGEYDVASKFASQAKAAGIAAPLMGGDGIKDDAFITETGPASEGDLASTVGAPAASIPSAQTFVAAYGQAGFAEPPSDFGVYAYDAANVLIAALVPAVQGTDRVTPAVRQAVVTAVQATDVAGASGRVAFDEFGDTRTKVLTIYRVENGKWTPVKTETVS
jgi:branched-chain amino acid transport system substrate-binding protein